MTLVREPVVAGRFYPATADECARMIAEMPRCDTHVGSPIGAVIPHAGWVYSGPTALLGISAITPADPETVIILGAVHVPDRNAASAFPGGSWKTPLGVVTVDGELSSEVTKSRLIVADDRIHGGEHSIEVEIPMIQTLLPAAKILPVMVSPGPDAPEVGRACVQACQALGRRVAILASTDLTHYGPHFGFEPHGRGREGVHWAKDDNDRRFIERIIAMDAAGVVNEAMAHRNACGAGAVAAAITAAMGLGATRYLELAHTCSSEIESQGAADGVTSVGYHAGVFCC